MGEFGLILENTNGFDYLENDFTMRGVPYLLGMRVSIDSIQVPSTGWSGDGVPNTCPPLVAAHAPDRCDDFDGSLRAFATAYIRRRYINDPTQSSLWCASDVINFALLRLARPDAGFARRTTPYAWFYPRQNTQYLILLCRSIAT